MFHNFGLLRLEFFPIRGNLPSLTSGFGQSSHLQSLAIRCQWECLDHVVEVQIGKALENLLKRRLTDRVLIDVIVDFEVFDHAEHLTDGVFEAGNSQSHVVSVLLEHFEATEALAEIRDNAVLLSADEKFLHESVCYTLHVSTEAASGVCTHPRVIVVWIFEQINVGVLVRLWESDHQFIPYLIRSKNWKTLVVD